MSGKKVLGIMIAVFTILCFCLMQDGAYSSDAYFSPLDIKAQTLRAIGECKESIDIAATDLASDDVMNALQQAKNRGVRVRIVVDRKHSLRKGTLSTAYRNKEFPIKVFIHREMMRHNFAIFDCRLLTTGTYSWNDRTGRFHRDNAIFTDEAKLLVKYQKEFEGLFHEGVAPELRDAVSRAEEKPAETIPATPAPVVQEQQVVASVSGTVITESPDGFISKNFDEFNRIFGVASGLSEEQKEALWNPCVNKKVQWRGKVTYMGWNLLTGWMMSVMHGDTSVEIKLNSANKARFSSVKYGNTVVYTGTLDSRVTRVFPYKLNDGDVLETANTSMKLIEPGALKSNPYIVPVSQGPKKIFLVETFEDLDTIFGKGSSLPDEQKNVEWKKYEGKYVSWSGQIDYKDTNAASAIKVGITQREKGDVEVRFGPAKKDALSKFQDGEALLYTGKLTERRGERTPYILEDGEIISLR